VIECFPVFTKQLKRPDREEEMKNRWMLPPAAVAERGIKKRGGPILCKNKQSLAKAVRNLK
jgi:hypothetical protein